MADLIPNGSPELEIQCREQFPGPLEQVNLPVEAGLFVLGQSDPTGSDRLPVIGD